MVEPASLRAAAGPAAVAAAERAFAQAAQEQGQWTAFAAWSTPDAVMFIPQPVNAHEFLQGRADPPRAVAWQPGYVWISCDATVAFSRGPWQRADGSVGYFTTVWQRQDDGSYKWVLDQGDTLPEPLPGGDEVTTQVADCPAAPLSAPSEPARTMPLEGERFSFHSADGTLSMTLTVATDLSRSWHLAILTGGRMATVIEGRVAGPEG
ncbi:MAG: hypothetical protein ABIT10_10135 [Alteraurantiacibacter sp.]